jgi:hypothetical protein
VNCGPARKPKWKTKMNPEELNRLVHRKPFRSFRLCLTDGESYEVHHPAALRIAGLTAVVFTRKTEIPSPFLYDRFDLVSLPYIVRAETL